MEKFEKFFWSGACGHMRVYNGQTNGTMNEWINEWKQESLFSIREVRDFKSFDGCAHARHTGLKEMAVCVCVCACVCVCTCVCACACMCVCMCVCVCEWETERAGRERRERERGREGRQGELIWISDERIKANFWRRENVFSRTIN